MKFRSFFWILITGTVTFFLVIVVGLGWIASQSSIRLLTGGVTTFPQAAIFLPKQTPGMVSLLTNPERLHGWYQVTLPLEKRNRDRQAWQQWEQDLVAKIGLDYQRDLKPWLGDEITLAITSIDYDRNPLNGAQPGYLLVTATQNTRLAQERLREFYGKQNNVAIEQYQGASLILPQATQANINSRLWSSAVAGNFVLFANQSEILKQAINQAQAVSLNLEQSNDYQMVLSNLKQPHIAIGYLDVGAISAWLDKSATLNHLSNKQVLAGELSLKQSDLLAQTILSNAEDLERNLNSSHSFLQNSELQQIISSLPFDSSNSAYIAIQNGKSLLAEQIPLYKVSKLAIQSLFPRLKAIAIQNLGIENSFRRTKILFKL